MDLTEKTIKSEKIYSGKIIGVRKDTVLLPNKKEGMREVVDHTEGVAVLPVTSDGQVILVRQFRYPFLDVITEIPAGKMDKGEEKPIDCGKRELQEETGFKSKNFSYLGKMYPSPGFLTEVIHLYLATDLFKDCQNLDDDEFLEVFTLSKEDFFRQIDNGQITDAKTIAAAFMARDKF